MAAAHEFAWLATPLYIHRQRQKERADAAHCQVNAVMSRQQARQQARQQKKASGPILFHQAAASAGICSTGWLAGWLAGRLYWLAS
jgi:hypothetical protein